MPYTPLSIDGMESFEVRLAARIRQHDLALDALTGGGEGDSYDVFSVVAYGADPTGVLDSTSAVQDAIDDAVAAVVLNDRRVVIYFPGGDYKFAGRVGVAQFDIDDLEKLVFLGAPGRRSRLHQNGDAASANWHLFRVQGGSTDIEYRDLVFDQAGIANAPEQSHLLQLGQHCAKIRIIDCEFRNTAAGDGIRILGDPLLPVTDVLIHRCKFYECARCGLSIQRWCQFVSVLECDGEGGTDQIFDMEPSAGLFTATAGSNATTLVVSGADFIAMGIVVGDRVYNLTENKPCFVTAVNSATSLTISAGCTDWLGDTASFAKRCIGHAFIGNRLLRGTNTCPKLLTLNGDQIIVANNQIQGNIFGLYCNDTLVVDNVIEDPISATADASASVGFIKGCSGLIIARNVIKNDGIANDNGFGIQISQQSSESPQDVIIEHNLVLLRQKGTGIFCHGVKRPTIRFNRVRLNTPGETTLSIAIFVGSLSGMTVDVAVVTGNLIGAEQGGWVHGVQFSATTNPITSVVVGGGSIENATNPIIFSEATGGVFTNPPIVEPGVFSDPTPPTSKKAVKVGVGVFRGFDTPEGSLTAGIGTMFLRTNGGAGTSFYIKESGAGNTGWVAK